MNSLIVAATSLLLASAAEAGHGGEHAAETSIWGPKVWGLPAVFWHFVNFAILATVLFVVLRKAMVAAQRTSREQVRRAIEESSKLRDEMRAKFEDYDARMKDVDARMHAILTDARAEADADKARVVTQATELAKRIREDAKLVADQEIARAKRELQEEQIAVAAELAEKILLANVNKDDQSRLSTEFIAKLESKPGAAAKTNGRPS